MSGLVIGLGYGPVTPASSHILIRNSPPHVISTIFSLKQSGVPLGGAMAGAIVPPIVLFAGWKTAALVVGAFCVFTAILVQPTRARLDGDRQPDRPITFNSAIKPLKMLFSQRSIMQLAIASFFFSGMQLCLIGYLVTYLSKTFGMALITAGLALSTAQTAGIIGRVVWGAVADRFLHPRQLLGLLGITMSLGAIGTGLFTPAWPYVAVLLMSALFGATAIGWNGVILAEVARLAPEGQTGMITGGLMFFSFFGAVLGPPLFGALVSMTDSYAVGYMTYASFTFTSGVILAFSRTKG
jgi:nitrate/nitrite transporter NarK